MGRRPRAHRRPRRHAADDQPQRERHHDRLARALDQPARRPRPARRRRDHRAQRARPARLPHAPGADARPQARPRPPGWPTRCPRSTWSSTCSASTAATSRPSRWRSRRELLAGLGLDGSWQVPAPYDDGAMLFDATLQQGLEGIVSKRRTSTYRPGERTPALAEVRPPAPAVVRRGRLAPAGGHVRPARRPARGGADARRAALPWPGGQRDRAEAERGADRARRRRSAAADSPFADEVPRVDAQGTHWLEPVLVVDIDTHGRGYDRLRQPSFQGVRTDLDPGGPVKRLLRLVARRCCSCATPSSAPAPAERRRADHVRLDGVDVVLRDGHHARSSPSTAPAATTPG